MRTNLKVFRIQQKLTQEQFAEKIGCSRASYNAIERGTRDGRTGFWIQLQKVFDVPDADLWGLMKCD